MSDSDDAVESSEDGDEDMDEDVVESSEDGDIDLEQISVGSSESSEDDSDAENSIEVPAPPLDDVGTVSVEYRACLPHPSAADTRGHRGWDIFSVGCGG
jgi:hypothetical protein